MGETQPEAGGDEDAGTQIGDLLGKALRVWDSVAPIHIPRFVRCTRCEVVGEFPLPKGGLGWEAGIQSVDREVHFYLVCPRCRKRKG